MAEDLGGLEPARVSAALAQAGLDLRLRTSILEALRQAEAESGNPTAFRNEVRWPLIGALLSKAGTHRVELEGGAVFEVAPQSRIEQALLLSTSAHPDHVWEPQTTRLLAALGVTAGNVIVGGAYIGDQVLLIARAMAEKDPAGRIHAFEPMERPFGQLLRNIELNHATNVVPHRLGLWDQSNVALSLDGDEALSPSRPVGTDSASLPGVVPSITINEYVDSRHLERVGLIMLDTEGGEYAALRGASCLLARPLSDAPNLVFEVHRSYMDWSEGLRKTAIVDLVISQGYTVFAIRDFQNNIPMRGSPIEIIPIDWVYLEGPPHGFNVLATKDAGLVERLGLRVVEKVVSPKLLVDRNPALHHPLDGLRK